MSGDVLRFELPLPPQRANARGHWRRHEAQRRSYFTRLDGLVLTRTLPRWPRTPHDRATIRAELHVARLMDDDNALTRCKWPTDWLVRRGYVVDDKRPHLRWESIPEQVTVPRAQTKLVLWLTPEAA